MTGRAIAAILLLAGLPTASSKLNAQIRPNAAWRQIQTAHFNIIYEAGLDSIAWHAAERAELEHARLAQRLARAPAGRIDIVLADNSDISNGAATPFPSNRVAIWVRPPVDEPGLQYYDDWIDLVVAHELAHSFHLDQAGAVGRALRSLFGRTPFGWPVFPAVGLPRWNIEGLATLIESQHTGQGRVYGSHHDMVVRTAVLENAFPTIDRLSGESPIWPGGQRAYFFGSQFMDYVTRRYGDRAQAALIGKTRGSLLPPPWRLDGIGKSALGRSFREVYADWHAELRAHYARLADSLRALRLTSGEQITAAGRWAMHPRISPDGRRLGYAEENGRDAVATRILELESGRDARVRRNGIGPLAWLPDNVSYITAQYDFHGRYRIYSDLYLVRAGKETRLTHGARAESPDVSPDGDRIVYVQNASGSNRLVVHDRASGAERTLAEASPDAQWTLPRFSPDGARIAVQRWTRAHGHDVVVTGNDGSVLHEIRTEGTDAAPAWSADGRFVLFTSDRTGIPNLYAYELQTAALRQVTNTLTGVFYPDVSRDGAWIYYSVYRADGYHIERLPFDVAAWRAPLPAAPVAAHSAAADTTRAPPATPVSDPRTYSPLRSALPGYWLPIVWEETALGTFVGAQTSGVDDVGRHSYSAGLAHEFEHGRVMGYLNYAYAGLGNPVLGADALRAWDFTGRVVLRNAAGAIVDTLPSYEREDRITVTASLLNRRWRGSQGLVVGAEGVVFNRGILGNARFTDPQDKLVGAVAGVSFANTYTPALAISPENGIRASVFARRRFELDPGTIDRSYTEVSGSAAAYRSVGGGRYAHEVVALRTSALHRSDLGRGPTDVGGAFDFLPVRGFSKSARIGFTAWTASLEYRMPLALIARGWRLRPFFIDRLSGSFFADAGNASCSDEQQSVYVSCPGAAGRSTELLVSAGFELQANIGILSFFPAWLRSGIAFPLKGDERDAKVYLGFGPSF